MHGILTQLYTMCAPLPPNVDERYIEMVKLQHAEVLDKIDELIELVNVSMKPLYIAIVVIILFTVVQIGVGIILAIAILNK